MFHLYHLLSFCSRCYGNSRNSCSSCIDRWRPWQCPCCAAASGLVVGWVSIAPCHARSHPQPPPLSLCLRNPWAWPDRIPAANHASPLVSQTCSYRIKIGIYNHLPNANANTGCPHGSAVPREAKSKLSSCPPEVPLMNKPTWRGNGNEKREKKNKQKGNFQNLTDTDV